MSQQKKLGSFYIEYRVTYRRNMNLLWNSICILRPVPYGQGRDHDYFCFGGGVGAFQNFN